MNWPDERLPLEHPWQTALGIYVGRLVLFLLAALVVALGILIVFVLIRMPADNLISMGIGAAAGVAVGSRRLRQLYSVVRRAAAEQVRRILHVPTPVGGGTWRASTHH